jgi:hypothetical protein
MIMPRGRKKGSSNTGPHLAVKEHRNGNVSLSICNDGAAAKLFLLNGDGSLERVVGAEEYVDVWNDEKIARSKRGYSKGQNGYLARGTVIKAAQKDDVVKMVTTEFKAVQKIVEGGGLKKTAKAKVEIIPLT